MADVDLTTREKVRRFLQKPDEDVEQDQIIDDLISRASRAIQTYCGVEFRPTAAASYTFVYRGGGRLSLAPYVAQSVSAVSWGSDTTSPTALTTTDYSLRPKPPKHGVYRWLRTPTQGSQRYGPDYPGERGSAETEVTVTGVWGYQTVPEDLEHACIVTVATWLRLHVSAFSTVFNIDEQQLERPEALPSAVRAGLSHYKQVVAP